MKPSRSSSHHISLHSFHTPFIDITAPVSAAQRPGRIISATEAKVWIVKARANACASPAYTHCLGLPAPCSFPSLSLSLSSLCCSPTQSSHVDHNSARGLRWRLFWTHANRRLPLQERKMPATKLRVFQRWTKRPVLPAEQPERGHHARAVDPLRCEATRAAVVNAN